jgi:hypothetical protein
MARGVVDVGESACTSSVALVISLERCQWAIRELDVP